MIVRLCLAFAMTLALVVPGQAEDAEARKVIDAYIAEMGGADAIKKRTSARAKGKLSVPSQGLTGDIEVLQSKPNLILVTIDIPGIGKTATGFDGKVGWSTNAVMGPALMEGKQLEQMKEQADFYGELHDPANYKEIKYAGKEKFEGKECHKLELTRKSDRVSTEFYDVQSKLLVGSKSKESSPLGDIDVVTVISEYKKFGELNLPTKSTQKLQGIEMTTEMSDFESDKVDPKAFELPPEIKALVKPD